jgi:hypothetical protein
MMIMPYFLNPYSVEDLKNMINEAISLQANDYNTKTSKEK